ncbi:MAG: aspartate kinase [Bacteroidales bacterium]|jgi:aspartate kinase|nr:aspartate kinase [Bacteroidales bacterium]
MKVLKFGGTSVGSPERIKNVSQLISDGTAQIVVLSAMSGTTNSLVEIADYYYKGNNDAAANVISKLEQKYHEVIGELLKTDAVRQKATAIITREFTLIRSFAHKKFDLTGEKSILARGEIISTNLVQLYHEEIGIQSVLLNALDFMRVDADGEPILSEIEERLTKVLAPYKDTKLFITQGFICVNPQGEIDNLKRGGSDYSASLIGAAINAEAVEIWTDIDGIHNNDPRIVKNTQPIAELSFDEAAELAYFGAKILHPATVLPAKVKNIPVLLKNTMEPKAIGTTISNKITNKGIKAVAAKDGLTVIRIKSGRMLLAYGFLRRVFEIFEKYKTSIDMITTSEVAISLTIDKHDYVAQIVEELKHLGTVEVETEQTIVCIVGNMINEKQGYAADVLHALRTLPVRMISFGGSRHNISIVVESTYKEQALIALHEHLFCSKN